MELLKTGFRNGGQRWRYAKIVGKSGLLTYMLDFLAVFPAWYAEPAGIILKLRWKFWIMGLELYSSASGRRGKACGSTVYEVKWEMSVYTIVGIGTCFVVGYLVSLFVGGKQKQIEGLTVYTLNKEK